MNLPLYLTLFGGLRICPDGAKTKSPTITRFRTQKTAALLAYLACHTERAHRREELIDRFWPDADVEVGRISLRTALASLRRQLEPPHVTSNAVLAASRTTVRLEPRAVVTDIGPLPSRDPGRPTRPLLCPTGLRRLARRYHFIPARYCQASTTTGC